MAVFCLTDYINFWQESGSLREQLKEVTELFMLMAWGWPQTPSLVGAEPVKKNTNKTA